MLQLSSVFSSVFFEFTGNAILLCCYANEHMFSTREYHAGENILTSTLRHARIRQHECVFVCEVCFVGTKISLYSHTVGTRFPSGDKNSVLTRFAIYFRIKLCFRFRHIEVMIKLKLSHL